MKNYDHELPYHDGWKKMTGKPEIPFANDYLFRALLQADEKTLRLLTSDLLHLKLEEITEIEITNPIVLGENVDDKEIHLDIRAILNGDTELNLEMQLNRIAGWIERSMLYACRGFDSLSHGDDYIEAGMSAQISFLNFTLFLEHPEFYATYLMKSSKYPDNVYTEKLQISAIDMTRIDLASDEDKKNHIDMWARLFKAASWEEVKMIAEKNPEMEQTASSIWQLTEDEKIKEQMRRKRANEHYHQMLMDKLDRYEKENRALTAEKATLTAEKEAWEAEREALLARLAEYEKTKETI